MPKSSFAYSPNDEGMTCGSSILAYLVFGPRRISTEEMTRPTNMIAWRGLGAILAYKARLEETKSN
jgi:hypothetical protein